MLPNPKKLQEKPVPEQLSLPNDFSSVDLEQKNQG
jgi:hypothetical protein